MTRTALVIALFGLSATAQAGDLEQELLGGRHVYARQAWVDKVGQNGVLQAMPGQDWMRYRDGRLGGFTRIAQDESPARKTNSTAQAQTPSLVVGGMLSKGLGEGKFAPYAEARIDQGGWRLSAQGELSRKVGSGGYRLGADVERAFGPFLLTGAYRHRDGGSWTKRGAWGGIGVGTKDVRLVLRQEIGGNSTRSATATLAYGPVEWQGSVYHYQPTFGGPREVGATALLALRLSAKGGAK